jgi:hypothetical protein
METWVFRLISVHCGSIGWGRVELGFILSLSTVFCSKLMLSVKDIVTIVSQVLNKTCCCILRGPSGERIVDVLQEGWSSNLRLRWEVGSHRLAIIPTSSVLEFIVHE